MPGRMLAVLSEQLNLLIRYYNWPKMTLAGVKQISTYTGGISSLCLITIIKGSCRLRSYSLVNTKTHPNLEVKLVLALLVLRRETALETRVL